MNNFDTSSHGVSLDLSVSFDLCRSQNDFNENFVRFSDLDGSSLLNDNYSRVNIFVFTGGSISGEFDLTDLSNYDLKSITNKNLLANIRSEFYGSTEDLKNDCINLFSKYPYQLTKLELIELIENEFSYDYQDFLKSNFDINFEVLSIRGYSQGDYAEIIFPNELLKEYSFDNKEKFLSMMEGYFTNLFYDAPLYARLEIDGQEVYLDDFQENSYSYDKDQILKQAEKIIEHKEKLYIMGWLADNLPEHPDHY